MCVIILYFDVHCTELQEMLQLKKKRNKKKKPMDMSAIEAQIDVSFAMKCLVMQIILNVLLHCVWMLEYTHI